MLCIRERDIEMLRVSTHEFCGREVILDFDGFHASFLMMPKHSPVRYTILTLEQPVPENKKIQRKAF